jgi:hypothetical protein
LRPDGTANDGVGAASRICSRQTRAPLSDRPDRSSPSISWAASRAWADQTYPTCQPSAGRWSARRARLRRHRRGSGILNHGGADNRGQRRTPQSQASDQPPRAVDRRCRIRLYRIKAPQARRTGRARAAAGGPPARPRTPARRAGGTWLNCDVDVGGHGQVWCSTGCDPQLSQGPPETFVGRIREASGKHQGLGL